MALMRGFSLVDESGRIIFPSNIHKWAEMDPEKVVEFRVLRIKGTRRLPHMTVNIPGHTPWVSPLEVKMYEVHGRVDTQGQITLSEEILEGMKLKAGYWVEMKLLGPRDYHWIVVYNRGPRRETTLQQRLGPKSSQKRKQKSWDAHVWKY